MPCAETVLSWRCLRDSAIWSAVQASLADWRVFEVLPLAEAPKQQDATSRLPQPNPGNLHYAGNAESEQQLFTPIIGVYKVMQSWRAVSTMLTFQEELGRRHSGLAHLLFAVVSWGNLECMDHPQLPRPFRRRDRRVTPRDGKCWPATRKAGWQPLVMTSPRWPLRSGVSTSASNFPSRTCRRPMRLARPLSS